MYELVIRDWDVLHIRTVRRSRRRAACCRLMRLWYAEDGLSHNNGTSRFPSRLNPGQCEITGLVPAIILSTLLRIASTQARARRWSPKVLSSQSIWLERFKRPGLVTNKVASRRDCTVLAVDSNDTIPTCSRVTGIMACSQ